MTTDHLPAAPSPTDGGEDMPQPTLRDVVSNANFVKLWIGLFVSFLGDRIGQMGLVAIAAAGATAATGGDSATMITFYAVLPYLVIGPVAGAIVDRVDRRHLMIATDVFRGLVFVAAGVSLAAMAAAWLGMPRGASVHSLHEATG